MNNTELITQVYERFAAGDVPGVLAHFDPQIKWHECESLPMVSVDALPLIGHDQVVQIIFAQIADYIDGFHIDVDAIFGDGDRVCMVGWYKGTWKATGKAFKANAAHIWTVQDGKATRFFQAVDTANIMEA